ncbi:hypothetical protein GGTG_08413 [Gaeumannomyces tritici R3-111a-1]|uniref:Uncharacterized protein n=1 Tax=Gaeumannomyces tritici (strain R3-111a-1) TaxID=644352 RepID=J3P4H6_GAET3|nr:hypothetical protein GGTG_08413 [Gaeumannomyces tritici R3-111a-1]EJT74573.1 hypothetical protein GGTG_08413 [Gaeumannomyces tritici R3-111a-1]
MRRPPGEHDGLGRVDDEMSSRMHFRALGSAGGGRAREVSGRQQASGQKPVVPRRPVTPLSQNMIRKRQGAFDLGEPSQTDAGCSMQAGMPSPFPSAEACKWQETSRKGGYRAGNVGCTRWLLSGMRGAMWCVWASRRGEHNIEPHIAADLRLPANMRWMAGAPDSSAVATVAVH